ncbi:hypothetical protein AB0O32_29315 [Streptomyces rubiginosohelvolus]|uniref:hypothetical protein n=2 Tax=Streptomyces rubiginosohelvolus TaxID=67362 RepID=UPI0033EDFD80
MAIGMAAASTGLSTAGGIIKGDPAGQVAASAIFGAATGGIGVGLKAAGATASTAGNLTEKAYTVGGYLGGAGISGSWL